MSDSEKLRVLSKLITLLTPYKIEDTVFYNIVKRREPNVIARLCSDDSFRLESSEVYEELCKNYLQDYSASAYFKRNFGFGYYKYYGDLGSLEITKANIDEYVFKRIGIHTSNNTSSCNLYLNLSILAFAGKITEEEAEIMRGSAGDNWLNEKRIYKVLHKQIFGIELEEEFERWRQLSANIESLKKEHELAIAVIKKEAEDEKNKQIDDFKASLQQELAEKNKQIEDYAAQISKREQRISTYKFKRVQLKRQLTEERLKVSKLEKENDKLRSQLRLIFSVREEIGASKLEEHDDSFVKPKRIKHIEE